MTVIRKRKGDYNPVLQNRGEQEGPKGDKPAGFSIAAVSPERQRSERERGYRNHDTRGFVCRERTLLPDTRISCVAVWEGR